MRLSRRATMCHAAMPCPAGYFMAADGKARRRAMPRRARVYLPFERRGGSSSRDSHRRLAARENDARQFERYSHASSPALPRAGALNGVFGARSATASRSHCPAPTASRRGRRSRRSAGRRRFDFRCVGYSLEVEAPTHRHNHEMKCCLHFLWYDVLNRMIKKVPRK